MYQVPCPITETSAPVAPHGFFFIALIVIIGSRLDPVPLTASCPGAKDANALAWLNARQRHAAAPPSTRQVLRPRLSSTPVRASNAARPRLPPSVRTHAPSTNAPRARSASGQNPAPVRPLTPHGRERSAHSSHKHGPAGRHGAAAGMGNRAKAGLSDH